MNDPIDNHDIAVAGKPIGIMAQETQPVGSILELAIISPAISSFQSGLTLYQYTTAGITPARELTQPPQSTMKPVFSLSIPLFSEAYYT